MKLDTSRVRVLCSSEVIDPSRLMCHILSPITEGITITYMGGNFPLNGHHFQKYLVKNKYNKFSHFKKGSNIMT